MKLFNNFDNNELYLAREHEKHWYGMNIPRSNITKLCEVIVLTRLQRVITY